MNRLLEKVNYRLNYLFIILTLVFGVFLYDIISNWGFTYTDEFLALLLFLYWYIKGNKRCKEFYIFIFIALFYLVYSLIFSCNVYKAVWGDFFIQIKSYIVFYSAYNLNLNVTERQAKKIRQFCIIGTFIMLPFGLIDPGGDTGIMNNLFIHSRYATAAIIFALYYYNYSYKTKKDLIISTLILSVGLLSLRSKMYGFYVVFISVMFFWRFIVSRKRCITLKTFIFLIFIVCIALYVTWNKIVYYFYEGIYNSDQIFARPALYIKAIEILRDYPFLGTGLGSYATFYSGVYYSPIYYDYNLDCIYGLTADSPNFIADTFFPSFAQVGLIGLFLFVIFWKKRIQRGRMLWNKQNDVYAFKMTIIIVAFFFIESTTDSTFTHNRGLAVLMLLAIINNMKNKSLICRRKP